MFQSRLSMNLTCMGKKCCIICTTYLFRETTQVAQIRTSKVRAMPQVKSTKPLKVKVLATQTKSVVDDSRCYSCVFWWHNFDALLFSRSQFLVLYFLFSSEIRWCRTFTSFFFPIIVNDLVGRRLTMPQKRLQTANIFSIICQGFFYQNF